MAPLVALMLGGCTVGPNFTPSPAPEIASYTAPGEQEAPPATGSPTFDHNVALSAQWWELFACPPLNAAVADGLAASPTIARAEATLKQAEDILKSGQGIFYPQIGADAGASREQPSPDATPLKFHQGTFNLFTLSAGVSYALDIFGGEKRHVESLDAQVEYQRNVSRAASLTLATNIANTFIASAAYSAEVDLTNELIELTRKQVSLARAQTQSGVASYGAELSLQSQLESLDASLSGLQQKEVETRHLLAVLEGKPPAALESLHVTFDALVLPQKLPLTLPADLVRQRPDILEAEAELHIASAEIGVATAAMFPNINLSGSFGYSDTATTGFFTPASQAWALSAGIAQPIFNGGALHYQTEAARDAYQAAAADYRLTVLSAFEQVADTLRAIEHDARRVASEERAATSARRSLTLVEANYTGGLVPYSDVLIADGLYANAQLALIQANAARYQDTVALFAALGGGWWNGQPQETAKKQ